MSAVDTIAHSERGNGRLEIGDLIFDRGRHQVSRAGQVIDLPKLSYRLFAALIDAAPNFLSHDELVESVWPGRVISPETVTQRVRLLRQALGDDASEPRYVGLVRGEGYRLLPPVVGIPDQIPVSRNLVAELSKRRVLQVAFLYAAIAWSITEAASFLIEALPVFPGWSTALVAIVFVLGFPIAMFLAWQFDVGPDGIRRADATTARGRLTIVGALALLVGTTAGLFYLLYPSIGVESTDGENAHDVVATSSNTLVVLPFVNAGGNPDDNFVSSGLADELRDQLGRVAGLRIAARSSSLAFRNEPLDAKSISERLGVKWLVEGTLRRQNDLLQISVQLIDGGTGFQVWSSRFDRIGGDLLSVQQEIADRVVGEVLPAGAAADVGTVNASAHTLMLQARHLEQQVRDQQLVDLQLLDRAIELYRKATEADPGSALAHGRLAAALLYRGDIGAAEAPIFRALELNPDLADVQYTLGLYHWQFGDERGERALERSIAVNPNNAYALAALAQMNLQQGRPDRAGEFYRRAFAADPMSLERYSELGNYYGSIGQREQALALAERIALAFTDVRGLMLVARIHETVGNLDEAIAWGHKSVQAGPDVPAAAWQLANFYDRIGDPETALQIDPEPSMSHLFLTRRYDELADLGEEVLFDVPDQRKLYDLLAFAYNVQGYHAEAARLLRLAGHPNTVNKPTNSVDGYVTYAEALDRLGETAEAAKHAQWLAEYFQSHIDRGYRNWWPNTYQACVLALLGEHDRALVALERLPQNPGLPWYPLLTDSPCFEPLQDNVRYLAVVAAIDDRRRQLRDRLPETLARHGIQP
ncbi:MAG: winged helix-turn-helix domain-containing protein [Gammaproteobacteria bacterium]|nr:winged helix-turn-helix domain-containing protein [Gammaproteobacteria bacterium]